LGSSSRLTATGNQLWDEGNTNVTGSALTSGDRFGAALAAGSMNGDRLWDLAIGAPGETVTSDAGAGSVTVLYAAKASSTQAVVGLGTTNAQTWDQSKLTSTGDSPTANEGFGTSLAIGDFNGDRIADLASETAAEDHNGGGPGAASIIFGTSSGLNAGGGSSSAEPTQVWIPTSKQIFPDSTREKLFTDPAVAAANLKAGKAFLAANKTKAGVITLADGVQYKKITTNAGGQQPTDANMVTVNYTGTLIDGTQFDSSADHGGPQTFPVTGVVPGFSEMLKLMHVGDHVTVYIPAALGYGTAGQFPSIPPNSVIIFDLQLVSIS
jgi:FKBP-type peptidyl-prolyl cis-trans isomerase